MEIGRLDHLEKSRPSGTGARKMAHFKKTSGKWPLKIYHIGVAGIAFLLTFCYVSSATALKLPPNGKCVPHVVARIPGRYAPTAVSQQAIISERQSSGASGPYCLVSVDVYRWIRQGSSRLWVNTGGAEMSGPGEVFSDGYWHDYPGEIDDEIQAVKVLPPGEYIPKNTFVGAGEYGSDQLLTYNHVRGAASEFSQLNIVGFWSPSGPGKGVVYLEDLLRICTNGTITWKVTNDQIRVTVRGESVSLRFDPVAQQMAILRPNGENIKLYRSLTLRCFRSVAPVMLP